MAGVALQTIFRDAASWVYAWAARNHRAENVVSSEALWMVSRALGKPRQLCVLVLFFVALRPNLLEPAPSEENHCGGGGRKKKNVAPPVESDDEELEVQLRSDPKQETMERLVTLAISAAVEGRSGLEFERDVFRSSLLGVSVGTSHHTRHFFRQSLYVADMVLSHLDCQEFDAVLDGLGTQGDFSLLCDPVSLGTGWSARHGTVLCMALCFISSKTYQPFSAYFAAPTMDLGDHAGRAMAELALSTLANHPGQYDKTLLRARLSLIGGDGGLTKGPTFESTVLYYTLPSLF